MKIIISIILFLIFIFWIGEFTINFYPFTVSLPKWRTVCFFIFMTIALSFYWAEAYKQGAIKALDEAIEKLKDR